MYRRKKLEDKLYYSIGEVADYFDVNESLLRYWEQEFSSINPKKIRGMRCYTKEDIKDIEVVYQLVKEKGMTLAGARQKLAQEEQLPFSRQDVMERLNKIKAELLAMRDELDRRPS